MPTHVNFLLLLALAVFIFPACGGNDEDDDMESGPDLTTRIVGSYDGTYFERQDGNFGPSYNGRAIVSVRKVDNTTVSISNGASFDATFRVELDNESTFNQENVNLSIIGGRDATITGMLTPGATMAEDVLTFQGTAASNPQFRISFTGTRRP